MANYKNRKPKKYSGCCGMCACRDHVMGLRNKRLPSVQEEKASDVSDWEEYYGDVESMEDTEC